MKSSMGVSRVGTYTLHDVDFTCGRPELAFESGHQPEGRPKTLAYRHLESGFELAVEEVSFSFGGQLTGGVVLGTPVFSFGCKEELIIREEDVVGGVGLHFVVLRVVVLENVPAGEVDGRGGEFVGPDQGVGMDEEGEGEEEE